MRSTLWAIPLGALAGCSTLTPIDDPLYLRLTDIDARLIRIERVFENESLIELAAQLQQLLSQTQSLRGEVETLRFETENAATGQRDLYLDADLRLQDLERAQAANRPNGPPIAVSTDNSLGTPAAALGLDQDSYDAAFGLIRARRYEEASAAFGSFLATYTNSPLSDNAQYWLAETYYVRSEFATALPEFQEVIDDYPQSAKLPDALLKVGYCNFELRQWDAARTALQEVERLFPDTVAARLASARLERIRLEAG